MASRRSTTPTRVTLCAKDPLPILGGGRQLATPPPPREQILRVSLLHNPATSTSPEDVKKAFALRRKYVNDLQAADARFEIAVSTATAAHTPLPSLEIVPVPADLNFDLIRAHEPSSAVAMYCTPSVPDRAQTALLQGRRPKPRLGSSHWQVLDEPLLPCRGPTSFSRSHQPHAFYVPARRSEKTGIKVVVDDLVDVRSRRSAIYQKNLLKGIERENKLWQKELRDRVTAMRDGTRRRKQDVMELAHKSGQLNAQSAMSGNLPRRRISGYTPQEPTADEAASLEELAKYDDKLWAQAQLKRKQTRGSQFHIDAEEPSES